MLSEIRVATMGVRSLEASREFYEGVFDYVEHGHSTVGGAEFEALWQLPASMTAEVLVLGPKDATSGLLRLVQCDQPGELYWGDYSNQQDYGHYAINIRVPDIHGAVDAIKKFGGRSKSEPTHWTVMPDLSAWDSLSYDPDGICLDVFQLEPGPTSLLHDYDGRPSPLQTIAFHSSDAKRTSRFYAALGFRPMYDKLLQNMESFFKIPQGTDLHNINMMHPDEPSIGRFEIAEYVNWPGQSPRDKAVPPALGILSASLETDDLDATIALLKSIGAEAVSERVEVDMPGLGRVAARSYFGPDDEVLEFFQRL